VKSTGGVHYISGETVARWFYDKYVIPKEENNFQVDCRWFYNKYVDVLLPKEEKQNEQFEQSAETRGMEACAARSEGSHVPCMRM